MLPLASVTLTLAPDFKSNSATSSNSSDIERDKGVNPAEFLTSKSAEFVPSKFMDSSKIMLTTSIFLANMAKCRGVCLKESNQILNYCRKIRFWIHTTYSTNNMGQKCEGNCGLWVLNEIILKIYAESLKKIMGAVWELPAK